MKSLEFVYTPSALRELKAWKKDHDFAALQAIMQIQEEIERTAPECSGRFSPEPLKGKYSGYFSRRISRKDRFVYRFSPDGSTVEVVQCRGHYGDH